jgi:hypothetical protein
MDWPKSWAPIARVNHPAHWIAEIAMTDFYSAKVILTPSRLDNGAIGRVLRRAGGEVHIETWSDDGWQQGGADFADFVLSREATADELQEAGVLAADLLP